AGRIRGRADGGVEPQVDAEGSIGELAHPTDGVAELVFREPEPGEDTGSARARDPGDYPGPGPGAPRPPRGAAPPTRPPSGSSQMHCAWPKRSSHSSPIFTS